MKKDNSSEDFTKGIRKIISSKPHVVILGAGASRAAAPEGDVRGNILPLMNDLVEVAGLDSILTEADIEYKGRDFEKLYGEIHANDKLPGLIQEIEKRIERYFDSLELPYRPTIYDHLLLSLRDKDLIATFNWDPFIVQAYARNQKEFKLPQIAFLHGNVKIGFCKKDIITGTKGKRCSKCGQYFAPSKLLYPIDKKDYFNDEFIANEWKRVQAALKVAFMVTFFGYSAPKTDVGAIELMKMAWGEALKRNMEQIEIIDIKDEDKLVETWEPFIHTHHYDIIHDFYDSWIAKHPRRTGEAYYDQYWDIKWLEDNPIPRNMHFKELWEWLTPLAKEEKEENDG